MTDPKRNMRGVDDLGRLIDQRSGRKLTGGLIRDGLLQAGAVPASGSGGSSGSGGDPALPEHYVEMIRAEGETTGISGTVTIGGREGAEVTQSAETGELTIACPEYSAGDGIGITGGEISCDATVVRTSGDQVIQGVKEFVALPLVPDSEPDEDTQVASKGYVDKSIPEVYWRRSGQSTISPVSGDALEIYRNATSPGLVLLNIGDSNIRHCIYSDGTILWGCGNASYDVQLFRSAANQLELGSGDALRLPLHLDLQEVAAGALATPDTGWHRLQALADGRLYSTTDTGRHHDLAVQHKQAIPGCTLAGLSSGAGTWDSAKYPASAVTTAPVTVTPTGAFNFTTGAQAASYGRWTVTADGTSDLAQAQFAAGLPFRKFGDGTTRDANCRVIITARIRVSDPGSLDNLYLFLNDTGSNLASADILSGLTAGTWAEVTLAAAGTDVSTWGSALRAGIHARGLATLTTTDTWTVDLEWLAIEQWCA